LLTPADVHHGRAEQITSARAAVLGSAYTAHPERFVRKHPEPPQLPDAAWINKPLDLPEPVGSANAFMQLAGTDEPGRQVGHVGAACGPRRR